MNDDKDDTLENVIKGAKEALRRQGIDESWTIGRTYVTNSINAWRAREALRTVNRQNSKQGA